MPNLRYSNCSRISSSFAAIALAMSARFSESFSASAASSIASISQANSAAFFAPSIATVATGMPGGISTVESSASRPFSVEDLMGTPMTGSVVFAAIAPARCAALPAAAMIAP